MHYYQNTRHVTHTPLAGRAQFEGIGLAGKICSHSTIKAPIMGGMLLWAVRGRSSAVSWRKAARRPPRIRRRYMRPIHNWAETPSHIRASHCRPCINFRRAPTESPVKAHLTPLALAITSRAHLFPFGAWICTTQLFAVRFRHGTACKRLQYTPANPSRLFAGRLLTPPARLPIPPPKERR